MAVGQKRVRGDDDWQESRSRRVKEADRKGKKEERKKAKKSAKTI
jgi:hypothetical protein